MSVMNFLREKWFLTSQRHVKKKRIFFLSDQWLTICDWKNGVFSDVRQFPQGEESAIADFILLMRQETTKKPIYILVDVIEEELRREIIPRLRGTNREVVLERRLGRLFPGTPLRRAVSQGRDPKGGERFLFSGLTKPTLVTPWLQALQETGHLIAGVWSVQLLSRQLLRELTARSENALLMGLHSGGLRQTFFYRGRTMISRLTPVAGRTHEELPQLLHQEADKSRWYLNSLRLLPADGIVDLYILAQGQLLANLGSWTQERNNYRVNLVDTTEVQKLVGLRDGMAAGQLERLCGQLLLQRLYPNHYAPLEHLYYHKSAKVPAEDVAKTVKERTPAKTKGLAMASRSVKRLGDLLVAKKIITTDQLQTALTEQKRSGDPLGKVFIALGFCSESVMRDLLAESLSQESIDLREVLPQQEVLQLVPKTFAQQHGVLPVLYKEDERLLVVAMSNPLNVSVLDQLQAILETAQMSGVVVKPMLAGEGEITTAIDRFYGFELSVTGILRELETGEVDMASLERDAVSEGQAISHPMVRLVNALLTDAIKRQVSDIHIGPTSGFVRIRYRIDGMLHLIYSLHRHLLPSLLVRIKVMAGMNIAESRIPQDGQISFFHAGRVVNFRISAHPTIHGENLVLRVLDRREEMSGPTYLGLSNEVQQRLLRILDHTMGLVLVTGPTGSGKTTTLYSILNHLNREEANIMTLEDPVEYPLSKVLQTRVNHAVGLDYATGIRSMLWQDPDVILVGEVHDKETAIMALQAAMTGHQVFTTLHAGTAMGAIPRLLNLGVEKNVIASNVEGIISQRLVRCLCKHCHTSSLADSREKQLLGLDESAETPTLNRAGSCDHCLQTGYQGRMPIMEILIVDDVINELIHTGASREQYRAHARSQNFRSMIDDARGRVLAGETTLEEVARVLDLTPMNR